MPLWAFYDLAGLDEGVLSRLKEEWGDCFCYFSGLGHLNDFCSPGFEHASPFYDLSPSARGSITQYLNERFSLFVSLTVRLPHFHEHFAE